MLKAFIKWNWKIYEQDHRYGFHVFSFLSILVRSFLDTVYSFRGMSHTRPDPSVPSH